MYLLLDECCPKALLAVASGLGHSAQRTIEVAALGRQASDTGIFAFACENGAVVVTVNRGDFVILARRHPDHHGLIVLPSLPPAATSRLFRMALQAAGTDLQPAGSLITVDTSGRIRRIAVP